MKTLLRLGAVLAAVALAAPALACSEYKQTTADVKVEQPAVATKAQPASKAEAKTAQAQPKTAKPDQKVAVNK